MMRPSSRPLNSGHPPSEIALFVSLVERPACARMPPRTRISLRRLIEPIFRHVPLDLRYSVAQRSALSYRRLISESLREIDEFRSADSSTGVELHCSPASSETTSTSLGTLSDSHVVTADDSQSITQ